MTPPDLPPAAIQPKVRGRFVLGGFEGDDFCFYGVFARQCPPYVIEPLFSGRVCVKVVHRVDALKMSWYEKGNAGQLIRKSSPCSALAFAKCGKGIPMRVWGGIARTTNHFIADGVECPKCFKHNLHPVPVRSFPFVNHERTVRLAPAQNALPKRSWLSKLLKGVAVLGLYPAGSIKAAVHSPCVAVPAVAEMVNVRAFEDVRIGDDAFDISRPAPVANVIPIAAVLNRAAHVATRLIENAGSSDVA